MMRRVWIVSAVSAVLLGLIAARAQETWTFDWEDPAQEKEWEFIDEDPKNLGDVGPSAWSVENGPIDGAALYQSSNIWGGPADEQLMGTFAVFKGQAFLNFKVELDVAAADNDGMGLVWGFTKTSSHNRVMMINDGWPDVPIDGEKGPMVIAHNRISDDHPWYGDPLAVAHPPDYVPYPENQVVQHWVLEVQDGHFKFSTDFGTELEGDAPELEGFIGIQLYAQQAYFDNIVIEATLSVDPKDKLATTWAALKR